MLVYVDDILIVTPRLKVAEQFKQQLHSKVEIKDLGECRQILGVKVQQELSGEISLSLSLPFYSSY